MGLGCGLRCVFCCVRLKPRRAKVLCFVNANPHRISMSCDTTRQLVRLLRQCHSARLAVRVNNKASRLGREEATRVTLWGFARRKRACARSADAGSSWGACKLGSLATLAPPLASRLAFLRGEQDGSCPTPPMRTRNPAGFARVSIIAKKPPYPLYFYPLLRKTSSSHPTRICGTDLNNFCV